MKMKEREELGRLDFWLTSWGHSDVMSFTEMRNMENTTFLVGFMISIMSFLNIRYLGAIQVRLPSKQLYSLNWW